MEILTGLVSTALGRGRAYEELSQGPAWRKISINVCNNGGESGSGDEKGLESRKVVLQPDGIAFFR